MRQYLQLFPLQLSVHSRWSTARQGALEPFRYAQLLTNRACVISELGSDVDMSDYEKMIIFSNRIDTWTNSVQNRCIVKGEAQKSPLFWPFSGNLGF